MAVHRVLVPILALLVAVLGAPTCPCSDASLCEPIKTSGKEVLGFSVDVDGWLTYDWNVLTTVAWNTNKSMLCKAHSHGARVVIQAKDINSTLFADSGMQQVWAQQQLVAAKENFLDGINFDYEAPIALNSSERAQYAELVKVTAKVFHEDNPYSQVSVDVAWGPFDVDGRNYDYAAIAEAADILFVMSYDTRSQIYGPCLASANTPLARAELGINQFLSLGISPDKLVLGLPWYGYTYPCINMSLTDRYCPIKAVPFQGAPCSDAAGSELSWSNIQRILRNTSLVKTPVARDNLLVSPWFNMQDEDGTIRQVWFDDVQSLTPKFALATSYNLRGVGVWNFDCLHDANAPASQQKEMDAMWQAMKVF
eukprot:m.34335 g.34335  ORF g.34335 m.34335 type:complete len:367 (+) comp12290_c0_seq1:55-1155(+)